MGFQKRTKELDLETRKDSTRGFQKQSKQLFQRAKSWIIKKVNNQYENFES